MIGRILLIGLIGLLVLVMFTPFLQNAGLSFIASLRSETVTLGEPLQEGATAEEGESRSLKIVTILGFDAIPAILNPGFITPEEAAGQFLPNEQVLGLSINGESRAYSIKMLSRHEIVNDVVGGVPVAITW